MKTSKVTFIQTFATALAVVLAVNAAVANVARGELIADSMSDPDLGGRFSVWPGDPSAHGFLFRTSSTGYIVTDVEGIFKRETTAVNATYQVEIWDAVGNSGAPGSQVGTVVANADSTLLATTYTNVAYSGLWVPLTPNTNYYLVFKAGATGSGRVDWAHGTVNPGTASGYSSGWAEYYVSTPPQSWDGPNNGWYLPDATSFNAMSITAVPEPSSVALAAFGITAAGLAARRRKGG